MRDPEQQPRSVFYFRDPLPYADMTPEIAAVYADSHGIDATAAENARRLAALKQRIVSRLPARVRRYTAMWDRERRRVSGLDPWGQMVLADIWRELDAETAGAAGEPFSIHI